MSGIFKILIATTLLTSAQNPKQVMVSDELSSSQNAIHQVMERKENPQNINEKTIVYGNIKDDSQIIQKDINDLIEKGSNPKIIYGVGLLYQIALEEGEVLGKEEFIDLVENQKNNGITISDLDDLGFGEETVNKIRGNHNIVSSLGININGKTILEENDEATAENDEATAENNEATAKNNEAVVRNDEITKILLGS